jgi:hypothetical protein
MENASSPLRVRQLNNAQWLVTGARTERAWLKGVEWSRRGLWARCTTYQASSRDGVGLAVEMLD